jgi:serine protease Do
LVAVGALAALVLAGCHPGPTSARSASGSPSSASAPVSRAPASTTGTSSSPVVAPSSSKAAPTPTPTTVKSLYETVSSGIVRINTNYCDGTGTGTGFLIGPNVVATVGHVVDGADNIRVTDPVLGTTSSAVVLGSTQDHQDLALLQTPVAIPGHVFTLDTTEPAVGTSIVVVGFSKGGSETISDGLVESIHQHAVVGGGSSPLSLSDMALTDAATNPGDSGGPWLEASGQVLALTDYAPLGGEQGGNGGVPAVDAAPLFNRWQTVTTPSPPAADGCAPTTLVEAAQVTLNDYFSDIDNSDYASAYAQETVATSPGANLDQWRRGVQSSQDGIPENFSHGVVIAGPYYRLNGEGISNGQPYLDVAFRSTQDGVHGTDKQTCTDWSLRYRFVLVNGVPLIKSALKVPGAAYDEQPCTADSPAPAVSGSASASPLGSTIYSPPATAP